MHIYGVNSNFSHAPRQVNKTCSEPYFNDKARSSRLRSFGKLAQTILLRPIGDIATLTYRILKLCTWVPVKASCYKISGYHTESATFFEREYLKTVKAVRDALFIPSVGKRAFKDMISTREKFVDDIKLKPTQDYLNVPYNTAFHTFSSYLHGRTTFRVIHPEFINEFSSTGDAELKTIMASHLFKPGMMAINFGCPNVASFVTEKNADGTVETVKVDAKSLWREDMTYHATHGKIQSGVFLVPKNLPEEALIKFKEVATKMAEAKRKDITCVNTNCNVLKEAGFSIEGVPLDGVIFPQTLFEHLMFRKVFFTGKDGIKHKVHFDIINTTPYKLEDYFDKVDTAVVGTRLRHRRRNGDTEENQKARGVAAQALIAQEAERLASAGPVQPINCNDTKRRRITVSVPSCLGDKIARIWGRHTIYEIDLSDKQQMFAKAFKELTAKNKEDVKLHPFPQKKPSFATRLKRDIFFSGPMIRLLRRHMMGRVDELNLNTQDLFKHLKSTKGARLNYVLLDGKVVLSRVKANGQNNEKHRKTADWALSKHALLSGRKDVYCSGEVWYDETTDRFMMNHDSGTYLPTFDRVKLAAKLLNKTFNSKNFKAVSKADEPTEVAKK